MNTKQIAEEAARHPAELIQRNYDKATYKLDWLISVIQPAIQAAIEKAYDEGYDRGFDKGYLADESRAAHASKPWTDEQVKGTLEGHGISGITRAHNATLQPAHSSEVEEQAWHDGTMSPEIRATINRSRNEKNS